MEQKDNNLIVIIVAGGKGTRWGNYLGVPKHFIQIEGERLIDRTIRLVKENAPEAKIYVVGSSNKYQFAGTELFIPKEDRLPHKLDTYLNSKELWNKNGRTVTLLGDIWYSDEAMKTIISYNGDDWKLFGRFGASQITFKPWREGWAYSFYTKDNQRNEDGLNWAAEQNNNDATGWYHYAYMAGKDVKTIGANDEAFVTIDDFTEDFDYPRDYEIWVDNRLQQGVTGIISHRNRNNISFIGVFRNESSRVRNVLDIAKYLCRDLILAVQKSDDNTLEICKEYTGNILELLPESPEVTKNRLMGGVSTPWVFYLDADEIPSLPMIRFIESFNIEEFKKYDAISFPRINYIDGNIVEVGDIPDRRFRLLKSTVRWDTELHGKVIHLPPKVDYPCEADYPLYHHRTLKKVETMTKRWNELEPKTIEPCNLYLKKVKEELKSRHGI